MEGKMAGYRIARMEGEPGKFVVVGGSKPYIVSLAKSYRGARCSCPASIYSRARAECKHVKMVRVAHPEFGSAESAYGV
jgi:predicted nucleic acid-binding Zn finger protein